MSKACVTVSLPDDVLGAIDEIRASEERTHSQVMARLLRAGLAVVQKPIPVAPQLAAAQTMDMAE